MNAHRKNNGLREDIQGLRAFAVLAVIFFHANNGWVPGGFIGVDVFFVISGFLISKIILRQKQNSNFSFLAFYLSRIKRIVPAYIVLLTIVSLCMAVLLVPKDFAFFEDSLRSSLYFASNQYFANFGSYFAPNANELPLLHTWTLAVEMQFYLLLPFILILTSARYLKMLLPAIIVLLTAYASYHLAVEDASQAMYFSLIARSPEFLIGSWIALAAIGDTWSQRRSNIVGGFGLLLLIGSAFVIDKDTVFPGIMTLPPCLGAAMIIAAQKGQANRLISNPVLVWLGGLSYSLYLWHWPVLATIRYYTERYEISVSFMALYLLSTLILAYLSYRWVETAFRVATNQKLVGIAIPVTIIALTITLSVSDRLNKSIETPLPVSYTRYAPKNDICHGKIVNDCIRGNKSSDNKILLLGDSLAAQLNYFFEEVGHANDQSIKIITASRCVTIPNFPTKHLPEWAKKPCLAQIENAKEHIETANTIVIAGIWAYQTRHELFITALHNFLVNTQKQNKVVIILAQTPMLTSNILRLRRFKSLGLPVKISFDNKFEIGNGQMAKIASKYSHATFLDLSRAPIFATAPFYNGELIYFDNAHLNEIGSRHYGAMATPYF
jgi:peptidoglycan/LPS O-acetylase OafA/YrhL